MANWLAERIMLHLPGCVPPCLDLDTAHVQLLTSKLRVVNACVQLLSMCPGHCLCATGCQCLVATADSGLQLHGSGNENDAYGCLDLLIHVLIFLLMLICPHISTHANMSPDTVFSGLNPEAQGDMKSDPSRQ